MIINILNNVNPKMIIILITKLFILNLKSKYIFIYYLLDFQKLNKTKILYLLKLIFSYLNEFYF